MLPCLIRILLSLVLFLALMGQRTFAQTIRVGSASIVEGDSGHQVLEFPVDFFEGTSGPVPFDVQISAFPDPFFVNAATGGAACGTAGVDFEAFTLGVFTIAANQPNGIYHVNVSICGDTTPEPNERFSVVVAKVGDQTICETCAAIGTIIDNDTPVIITDQTAVTVPEGGTKTFQVKLSKAPVQGTVTVNVSRFSGDADITVQSGGNLTFTAANFDTFQTVTLAAAQDTDTLNGTATIRLSGTTLVSADVTATESDNEVGISINDISIRAPSSGTRVANFTVSLSRRNFTDVSVHFATRDDTARAQTLFRSGDYLSTSGTLTIPAGSFTGIGTIPVTIVGDIDGNSESFSMDLSSATAKAIITKGVGQCVILPALAITTGEFDLRASDNRARVGQTINYQLTWTVPEGRVWRNLDTIDLRIRQGNKTALWVHWDEAANTFRICESGKKKTSVVDCTSPAAPGSAVIMEGDSAQIDLAHASVIGSGPTGQSVTLNLPITFIAKAEGRYLIELAASDDFGHQDDFVEAGTIQVHKVGSH